MNICVPKERRTFEFRAGLTPGAVQMLTKDGHVHRWSTMPALGQV
jgi:alanine dehydrogenase